MSGRVQQIRLKIEEAVEIPLVTKCCFCIPLRKGLLVLAYLNIALSSVLLGLLLFIVISDRSVQDTGLLTRLVIDTVTIFVEILATIVFVIALHRKNVRLMRGFLCFGIAYTIFCFIYSLAFVVVETGGEVFVIFSQLLVHVYFMIMVWSSLVKMERDGTVKYVRENKEQSLRHDNLPHP